MRGCAPRNVRESCRYTGGSVSIGALCSVLRLPAPTLRRQLGVPMARDTETIQNLLEAGLDALNRGDYDAALACWNDVLERDPSHGRAARLVRDLSAYVATRSQFDDAEESSIIVVLDDAGVAVEADGGGRQRIGSSGDFPRAPNLISRQALERLQELVEGQRAEVERLTDTISERDEQILDLRSQLTARDRELLEIREASLDIEKTAARSERERRELERVRHKLDEDLAAAELSVADHRKHLEKLQGERDGLQRDHDALVEARDLLRDERDTLASRLEAAGDDTRVAEERAEELEAELLELRNALTSERAAADEVRDELNAARTQLKLGEQTARRTLGELEQARTALRDAESVRDDAVAERDDARRAATELDEAHRDAVAQRTELAEELDRARSDYERLLASAQETSDQLAAANRALEERTSELAEYREHADEQLEHGRGEVQRLLDLLSERDGDLERLREEATDGDVLREQIEGLRDLAQRLTEERDAIAEERDAIAARVEKAGQGAAYAAELEEQLDTLRLDMRRQADQLEELLAAAARSISRDDHEREINDRDEELASLRARLDDLQNESRELDHLRRQNLELEDEVDRLRQDMKATYSLEAVAVDDVTVDDVTVEDPPEDEPVGDLLMTDDDDLLVVEAGAPRNEPSVEQQFEAEFHEEFELDIDMDADTGAEPVVPEPEQREELAVAATDPAGVSAVGGNHDTPTDDAPVLLLDEDELLEVEDPAQRSTVRRRAFESTNPTEIGSPVLSGDSDRFDVGDHDIPELFDDEIEQLDEPTAEPRADALDVDSHEDDGEIVFSLADDPAPSGAYDAVADEGDLMNALADDPQPSGEYDAAAPAMTAGLDPTPPGGVEAPADSVARARLADDSLSPSERLAWILDEVPSLTSDALGDLANIGAREAFVAQNVDGNISFGDILDIVSLPADETAAILVELVNRRLVTSPSLD